MNLAIRGCEFVYDYAEKSQHTKYNQYDKYLLIRLRKPNQTKQPPPPPSATKPNQTKKPNKQHDQSISLFKVHPAIS